MSRTPDSARCHRCERGLFISDYIGDELNGTWCSYCGAPSVIVARYPMLGDLIRKMHPARILTAKALTRALRDGLMPDGSPVPELPKPHLSTQAPSGSYKIKASRGRPKKTAEEKARVRAERNRRFRENKRRRPRDGRP